MSSITIYINLPIHNDFVLKSEIEHNNRSSVYIILPYIGHGVSPQGLRLRSTQAMPLTVVLRNGWAEE